MGKNPNSTSPNGKPNTSNKISQTAFDYNSIPMASSLLTSIEKLKGRENYSTWKFSIENYLEYEDLLKCIDGTETDAKKNVKAKASLNLSIDKTVQVHVKSAKTAKEIWDNLKTTFEDHGAGRKVTLFRHMINTQLSECESMEKYVSQIVSTSQLLSDVDFNIPDEILAVTLLSGLTIDYQPMVIAMESTGKKLTADAVKTRLLQEPVTTQADDEKAFFAKNHNSFSKKRGLICYSCRQKGHKSFNCPSKSDKFDDKKPQKANSGTKNSPTAFSAVFLSGKYDRNDWYIDSGASRHMTMRDDWMDETAKYGLSSIRAANNEQMEVNCSGKVIFDADVNGKRERVEFQDVLCVPNLTANLLSVSEITNKGKSVLFTSTGCVIKDADGQLLGTGSLIDGLYRLNGKSNIALAAFESNKSMELWHRRLGHVNPLYLKKMKEGGVSGISFEGNEQSISCIACCKGKQSRKPFPKHGTRATQLLETIHGDLAGKMDCASIGGSKYCFVLVDDFSRRTFAYMLKHKNEAFDRFCSFKRLVENQTGLKIKRFRSDNGTEFFSKQFGSFLDKHGIQHQSSIPHTPEQNGLAERTIRTITEKARCMLQDANLPKKYWAEAIHTATYIKNHTTSTTLEHKSPIEIWSGKKPDVSHFKVFGSIAMAMIPKGKRQKFDAKSRELMFVGYCEDQKGYRLMDRLTNKVISCRDVTVIEHGNNFSDLNINNNDFEFFADDNEINASEINEKIIENSDGAIIEVSSNQNGVQHGQNNVANQLQDDHVQIQSPNGVQHGLNNAVHNESFAESTLEDFEDATEDVTYVPEMDESDEEQTSLNDSEIQPIRRSERELRPVQRYDASHFANEVYNGEPFTVSEALNGDDKSHWKTAMDEEYRSLLDNATWELIDLPKGSKAINNKWVFKQKTDCKGNIIRYKARLVAKGCSQREGIDYFETFSPVVRYSSIRLLMALAVKKNLNIEQMDVVTAFLHGEVDETIYMKQPEGYADGSDRVCLLRKSLYGLKQASRQWNLKLNEILITAGFLRCKTDSCIYVRRNGASIVIVAVYVDDLLILYNNSSWKDQLKSVLTSNFNMKDLGNASNVLGIRIEYDKRRGTINLDQQKYAELVLRRFNMFDCDPVKLPSDPNQKLTREMSPSSENEIKQMGTIPYQEAVGSILYLAQCTRPDISFAITNVSQFNKNPGLAHWRAVKRILRYIKGTLNCKLTFARDSKYEDLCAHTDADWASSFCDRKSCSGYIFLWQGGAISWLCKKQPTVALSTVEAEYMSLSAACQEAYWLNQLKDEIIKDQKPILQIFSDNKGAIDLAQNGAYSAKTKHIDIRHHFIRDYIRKKIVKISKIGTDKMIADFLTKAVPIDKHTFCSLETGLNV